MLDLWIIYECWVVSDYNLLLYATLYRVFDTYYVGKLLTEFYLK